MSADLVWQLTRKCNSHHLRRTHPVRRYTTEKGSICGSVTFSDSGIGHRRAVDVSPDENGVPVLSCKNEKACQARKPDQMWSTTVLHGGARKAISKADAIVTAYRPASKKLVLRKVSLLSRANARAKAGINHAKIKKGRY